MNYSAVLQFMDHRLGIYLCTDYLHTPKPFVAATGNILNIYLGLQKNLNIVIHVSRIWKIYCH